MNCESRRLNFTRSWCNISPTCSEQLLHVRVCVCGCRCVCVLCRCVRVCVCVCMRVPLSRTCLLFLICNYMCICSCSPMHFSSFFMKAGLCCSRRRAIRCKGRHVFSGGGSNLSAVCWPRGVSLHTYTYWISKCSFWHACVLALNMPALRCESVCFQ